MLATKTRETKTRNGAVHPPVPQRKAPPVVEHFTVAEREVRGLEARKRSPRSSHAGFTASPQRPDPVALLQQQSELLVP